jgi:protoporphyrinogen oxidase
VEWRPEVLILGAGAAGLTAARRLSMAGLRVEILEARRRIGGRIHTLRDPLSPVPVELGAEFVHGRPRAIWRAIEQARLAALELDGEEWCFEDGRLGRCSGAFHRVGQVMAGLDDAPEQSFRDYVESFETDASVRRWASGYVEGFNAARQEKIGVRALARQEQASREVDGDRTFRLAGGYSTLVDWLWSGANRASARLRLGTAVRQVAWRRGQVEIAASMGDAPVRFEAPRVIVTLPIGVLKG